MKNPTSILVILDKPKHVQTALARALEIQASSGAELRLVSFVWQGMVEQKAVFDAQQRRALKKEILRVRENWLRDLIRDSKLSNANLTIEVVWTSDIGSWVAGEAEAADLVVKSVHKTQTLLHTPLDWELLNASPCPLLLVGTGARQTKKRAAARDVLATLDLRNTDRSHRTLNLKVLDAANRFAELRGGKLHCVAVVEFSEVLSDLEIIDPHKIQREVVRSTREFLQTLIEPYPISRTRIHRPVGKVGHMVAATARKTGAGLVVVGSAAKLSLGARVLGSSAEKILQRSPTDVLVVHPS